MIFTMQRKDIKDKNSQLNNSKKLQNNKKSLQNSTEVIPGSNKINESPNKNTKIHFKSAYSMLLDLGVLGSKTSTRSELENSPMEAYQQLVRVKSKKESLFSPKNENLIEEARQYVIMNLKKHQVSRYTTNKLSNPVLCAAEKLLLKCNLISKKTNLNYQGQGRRSGIIYLMKK